jgi:hypothetical protein
MLLIVSISTDSATNLICHYLNQKNDIKYLRINLDDNISVNSITFKNNFEPHIKLVHENIITDLNSVSLIWYRNGHFFQQFVDLISMTQKRVLHEFINFHSDEIKTLNNFIFSYLEKKK